MKFEHLSKSFDGKVILDDFCLELPARGTVVLMGPSGCGKTTLMRILAGLETPDRGHIIHEKQRLSMVFQEDRLLGGVTALGNILAVLDRHDEPLAMSWLKRMGIDDACHLLPHELSGGMRRRLAIARAMAYQGDLMLLDEPFAGLDDTTREQIYPHLFDPKQTNRLTILITHDHTEAQRFANHLITTNGPPLRVVKNITR